MIFPFHGIEYCPKCQAYNSHATRTYVSGVKPEYCLSEPERQFEHMSCRCACGYVWLERTADYVAPKIQIVENQFYD